VQVQQGLTILLETSPRAPLLLARSTGQGQGVFAAGGVGQHPSGGRAGRLPLGIGELMMSGGLVVTNERGNLDHRREFRPTRFGSDRPGRCGLTHCRTLLDECHAVPVVHGDDCFVPESNIAGRPVRMRGDRRSVVAFSPAGPLCRELVDPFCGISGGAEVEQRAVGLRIQLSNRGAERMIVKPRKFGDVPAPIDLPCQSGSRHTARPRADRDCRPRIGKPRLGGDQIGTARQEGTSRRQGRRAWEAPPAEVPLDRLYGAEKRRRPALLVHLDDDIHPGGEPHPNHRPNGGSIEQGFRRWATEVVLAEPFDGSANPIWIAGTKDLLLDRRCTPPLEFVRNEPGDRFHPAIMIALAGPVSPSGGRVPRAIERVTECKTARMDLAICVRNLSAAQLIDVGRFAEDHGYSEIFVPDGAHGGGTDDAGRLVGRDAMATLAAMFSRTNTVRGALGVASLPMHHHLVLPVLASTLNELSDGRFSLGLGVSHPEQTKLFGADYPDRPIDYMRGWIRDLKARSRNEMAYGAGWPVLVAALGPRMVQLGAEEADGLILNWLTPEHAADSVRRIRAAAPDGDTPRTALYLRLMSDDALHADAGRYDAMANYHRNFLAQGITTPAEIVDRTTLPRDDLGAARARLDAYRDSGLDTVCIYPMGFDADDHRALEALTR
jgi:alkanesulfonate monooxygenase SsuD/methylene tetrahydromethanopterin reductase-like flavin-dependent oxidoreductase (luciferase family)